MRVLVLNHNLRERGTWFRARKVARGLWARGHDVTFVCTGPSWYRPRLRAAQERWTCWESASWVPFLSPDAGWSPLGAIQRAAKCAGRWDLIYTFSHKPVDQAAARLLRAAGAFWMTDWCDLWAPSRGGILDLTGHAQPLPPALLGFSGLVHRACHRLDEKLEDAAARGADGVSIISSWMRTQTDRLGVPPERVHHLISGCDARIRPMDSGECRRELALPADRILLGYVANVTEDNALLEAALARVLRERPDVGFFTVGPRWHGDSGPVADAIAEGRAWDFGRQPFERIPTFLGAADVLLMPLRATPFNLSRWPNKFSDYMAAGRATAACDVGDMGRVVRKLAVGTAGEPTPEGFAQAILSLVDNSALRQDAGANARRAAETRLSWPGRISRLARFLQKRGLDGI